MSDLERTARELLELWAEGPVDDVLALLHPEASIAPKAAGGAVLRGRDETRDWLVVAREWPVYRIKLSTVSSLADDAVIVKGRMQWMTDGILRDSPCVWVIEFADGLVRRSRTFASVAAARRAFGATRDVA